MARGVGQSVSITYFGRRRSRCGLLRVLPFLSTLLPVRVLANGASAAAPLCPECLREPAEVEYFGGTPGGEPRRLSGDVSREDFEQAALSGHVLIIENATEGAALAGWNCDRLADEFPEGRMRREYDWVKNGDDRNLQKLGAKAWIDTREPGEDSAERLREDKKAPPFAPFYWGIREHREGDVGSRKVVARIKDLIRESVPRFMDPQNAESMFDNAEFWLGWNGTGARAHMDSHCISTLSMVLSGERRWRVGPVPRMPKGVGRSGGNDVVFDDGVAYRLGWKPMYEFVVKEGEAVLFPPGWIHETLNSGDGCTVALTTQFSKPHPVRYYRNYYQRLRRVGDLNPCWARMMQWGSTGETTSKGRAFVPTPERARQHAEERWEQKRGSLTDAETAFFDMDSDGEVTHDEFVESYTAWVATERAAQKEKRVRTLEPDMRWAVASPANAKGQDEL